MNAPTSVTLKRLFAMSGNHCAFPDCDVYIVQDDGTVIGEICHIKARNTGGPRYDSSQSELERHGYDNLLLLCRNHHRVVDTQCQAYSTEVLCEMKALSEAQWSRPERASDGIFARALLNQARAVSIVANRGNVAIDSPGAIQAQTIVLKTLSGKVAINSPPGTIGSELNATRYAKYLIDRNNEFAKVEPSRNDKFSYAVVYKAIERQFGSSWRLVPMNRFDELCAFLQARISRTRVAKLNDSKSWKAFSSYAEFIARHGK